ncbi:hypothetical protein BGW36DRAFT_358735 [Talaromyces proteolyticus]|uniref:Xylanolytic transcriptional activator regulatory domain-containing protein n=1 Tax=Talaromyces proteolyticus TaxID=1131652 RepID=A0AAD4KY59_9EURO|nr:uncharacterized protein BGW36DRAFT_358735 [Talaromyces proteolyticus]KAH8699232.1 hypothetical protein BGW36DRAFT_358735 [Talaromyces proteolyticus]
MDCPAQIAVWMAGMTAHFVPKTPMVCFDGTLYILNIANRLKAAATDDATNPLDTPDASSTALDEITQNENQPRPDQLGIPASLENISGDIHTIDTIHNSHDPSSDIFDNAPADGNIIYSSYGFLDVNRLSSLPKDDVDYLVLKRCLHVPLKDSLDDFVKQYFTVVHPFVPMIDEAEFWRLYLGHGNVKKLSLFVFQAMLFSCCATLFDLNAEDSSLAKAQGAVLLSHHSSAEDPQAASIWLAVGIRIAMTLDSHPMLPGDEIDKSMTKRLWWSIILRDRSLCLGLRRHPQVTAVNFMADSNRLVEKEFEDEIRNSHVFSEDVKRQLFAALQEQCQLAVLLNDGLSIIFPPPGPLPQTYSSTNMNGSMSVLQAVKHRLIQWSQQSTFFHPESTSALHESVILLTQVTSMYYFTAQISIAHHEALLAENEDWDIKINYTTRIQEIARDLRRAIDGLILVIDYFNARRGGGLLPLSVLAYVGMPLILSAIDLKLSPSYSQMLVRRNRLNKFAEIIRQSRSLYEVTDLVAAGTNQILQLAYAIIKELFLRRKGKSILRRSSFKPRATTWNEAYLRYPRAYLYISKSVEYGLSLGRLPNETALPEQVRHVPSIVLGTRVPWTLVSSPTNSALIGHSQNDILGLETNEMDLVFGLHPITDDEYSHLNGNDDTNAPCKDESHNPQNELGILETNEKDLRSEDDNCAISRSLLKSPAKKKRHTASLQVNLDYFDADPRVQGNHNDPTTFFKTRKTHAKIASPGKGEAQFISATEGITELGRDSPSIPSPPSVSSDSDGTSFHTFLQLLRDEMSYKSSDGIL